MTLVKSWLMKILGWKYTPWLIGLIISTTCSFILPHPLPAPKSDEDWYRLIAVGRINEVNLPFAQRFLHPFIVRAISLITHITVDQAFLAVHFVLLAIFIGWLLSIWRKHQVSHYAWLLFTPFLLRLGQDIYLYDLAYAVALLAVFATIKEKITIKTLFTLIICLFIRESTLLAFLVLIALLLIRKRRPEAIQTGIALIVALIGSNLVAKLGQPNIHGLSSTIYLTMKIVANAIHNLTGFMATTNTFTDNAGRAICDPVWQMELPKHFGSITFVGLCPWDPRPILNTFLQALIPFGITIIISAQLLIQNFKSLLRSIPLELALPLWLGITSFILAPFLGTSVDRLFASSWPVFLFAVPLIIKNKPQTMWLAISFGLSWIGWLATGTNDPTWMMFASVGYLIAGIRYIQQVPSTASLNT